MARELGLPAESAIAVTPHDSNNLVDGNGNAIIAKHLWIGGAGTGTLKVTTFQEDDVSFVGVPVGKFDLVRVKRVWATGTGVTDIVACYS